MSVQELLDNAQRTLEDTTLSKEERDTQFNNIMQIVGSHLVAGMVTGGENIQLLKLLGKAMEQGVDCRLNTPQARAKSIIGAAALRKEGANA